MHNRPDNMTGGIGSINLKVVVMDSDYYAMQSLNGYLAWDRRTRVTFMTTRIKAFWDYLRESAVAELPDVIVLDADHLGDTEQVRAVLRDIFYIVPDVMLICLAQALHPDLVETVAEAGARAYLLKHEVGMQIAWAIVYALEHEFLLSPEVHAAMKDTHNKKVYEAAILPEQRDYPEMTDRIRQAIRLCVIEGMPAHLAADEMGISLHTIRGYIKEGYRILESYDQEEYPTDMTPQERAFMRFTALSPEDEEES
jgi:DNA-binding NarL/FixJ family response regulator